MAEVLVADDDSSLRIVLNHALSRAGHDVRVTSNAGTLWRWIESGSGDVVISDVVMPDQTAFDILPRIRNARPDLPVIVMSAQNTFMTAIRATESGAYDYLPKPFDLPELLATVERALTGTRPVPVLDLDDGDGIPLVGRSPAMQDVFRVVARVMQTDLTVLIVGESGTGKELVARALHDYGPRRRGPFVAVNMAAIPQELVESELFGHEKGAFTGALARSAGRFEQANGGTLFLDEIGDMPMAAQTRLLRVLQEGEYTSVGGRTAIATDVRIVTATNRSLPELIEGGRFREDLFYRLNVVPLRLPPLRERASDVPDLVRHFFAAGVTEGLPNKAVDPNAMRLLQEHSWPGNVRELENLVRRLAVLYPQTSIGTAQVKSELTDLQTLPSPNGAVATVDLQQAVASWLDGVFADADPLPSPGLYHRTLEEIERPLLTAALAATHGNQIRAAEILGLNRNTLRKKIRDLDLTVLRDPR